MGETVTTVGGKSHNTDPHLVESDTKSVVIHDTDMSVVIHDTDMGTTMGALTLDSHT